MSVNASFATELAWLHDQVPTVEITYRGRVLSAVMQRDILDAVTSDSRVAGGYTVTFDVLADTLLEEPRVGERLTLARDGRTTLTYAIARVDPLGARAGWKLAAREVGANA